MNKKEIYICENCGKEFEGYTECKNHEAKCNHMHLKFRNNVQGAIIKAKIKYGSIITDSSFKTDEEVDDYDCNCSSEYELYKFEIDLELSNGNHVSIYDGFDEDLSLGNYLEEETIYKSLEKAIEDGLTLLYEGIIHADWERNDGWRSDMLGSVEICDIVDRLEGRKVRLEVIE